MFACVLLYLHCSNAGVASNKVMLLPANQFKSSADQSSANLSVTTLVVAIVYLWFSILWQVALCYANVETEAGCSATLAYLNMPPLAAVAVT